MRETQQSISDWANATFGPSGSDLRVWARVNEEMAELLRALATEPVDPQKAIGEAADALIIISRLGVRVGAEFEFQAGGCHREPWLRLALGCQRVFLLAGIQLEYLAEGIPGGGATPFVLETARRLCGLIEALGGDPQAAVDAKMSVNRARQWKLDGSGHGYHVKTGAVG